MKAGIGYSSSHTVLVTGGGFCLAPFHICLTCLPEWAFENLSQSTPLLCSKPCCDFPPHWGAESVSTVACILDVMAAPGRLTCLTSASVLSASCAGLAVLAGPGPRPLCLWPPQREMLLLSTTVWPASLALPSSLCLLFSCWVVSDSLRCHGP